MITRFDHFVLTVASIDATVAFYEKLGFEAETSNGRTAIHFAGHKINLHEIGHEFSPHARVPAAGSSDFCLITEEPIMDVVAKLTGLGIVIEEGPVARTGARAPLASLYMRDPDGNLVEIANEEADAPSDVAV